MTGESLRLCWKCGMVRASVVVPFAASRPATWSDRLAGYKRLRSAGYSHVESLECARGLVEVPDACS